MTTSFSIFWNLNLWRLIATTWDKIHESAQKQQLTKVMSVLPLLIMICKYSSCTSVPTELGLQPLLRKSMAALCRHSFWYGDTTLWIQTSKGVRQESMSKEANWNRDGSCPKPLSYDDLAKETCFLIETGSSCTHVAQAVSTLGITGVYHPAQEVVRS